MLYDQPTGRLALVFELMDANLYELIRGIISDKYEADFKYFTHKLTLYCTILQEEGIT